MQSKSIARHLILLHTSMHVESLNQSDNPRFLALLIQMNNLCCFSHLIGFNAANRSGQG